MTLPLRALPYLGAALLRKAKRILMRQDLLATQALEQKRLAICRSCPHRVIHNEGEGRFDQCDICGCVLILKVKFVDETCPLRPNPRW